MIFAVGALCSLAACSPEHDVDYYRGHPTQRAQFLVACNRAEARFAVSTNCAHAFAADGDVTTKAFLTVRTPRSRIKNPGKL